MDMININSALSSVQQYDSINSVPAEASMMMLNHVMESNAVMSNSMLHMMELSVNPHIGSNIDLFV